MVRGRRRRWSSEEGPRRHGRAVEFAGAIAEHAQAGVDLARVGARQRQPHAARRGPVQVEDAAGHDAHATLGGEHGEAIAASAPRSRPSQPKISASVRVAKTAAIM